MGCLLALPPLLWHESCGFVNPKKSDMQIVASLHKRVPFNVFGDSPFISKIGLGCVPALSTTHALSLPLLCEVLMSTLLKHWSTCLRWQLSVLGDVFGRCWELRYDVPVPMFPLRLRFAIVLEDPQDTFRVEPSNFGWSVDSLTALSQPSLHFQWFLAAWVLVDTIHRQTRQLIYQLKNITFSQLFLHFLIFCLNLMQSTDLEAVLSLIEGDLVASSRVQILPFSPRAKISIFPSYHILFSTSLPFLFPSPPTLSIYILIFSPYSFLTFPSIPPSFHPSSLYTYTNLQI